MTGGILPVAAVVVAREPALAVQYAGAQRQEHEERNEDGTRHAWSSMPRMPRLLTSFSGLCSSDSSMLHTFVDRLRAWSIQHVDRGAHVRR
jgi:hypothetical protein